MAETNDNARLESFSDGVFAIALTLLILEIKIPPLSSVNSIGEFWRRIFEEWPSWFGFTLSFIIILIGWVNHHAGSKLMNKFTPLFIYANGFLLFTVVVLPFATGVMAEYFHTPYAQPAISLYCFILVLHNLAWNVLMWTILHPVALTKDKDGKRQMQESAKFTFYGLILYPALFILSFWFPITAMIIITSSFVTWLVLGILMHPKNQQQ